MLNLLRKRRRAAIWLSMWSMIEIDQTLQCWSWWWNVTFIRERDNGRDWGLMLFAQSLLLRHKQRQLGKQVHLHLPSLLILVFWTQSCGSVTATAHSCLSTVCNQILSQTLYSTNCFLWSQANSIRQCWSLTSCVRFHTDFLVGFVLLFVPWRGCRAAAYHPMTH